jgi:two-component system, NarL family, sensor histidine kinase DevS
MLNSGSTFPRSLLPASQRIFVAALASMVLGALVAIFVLAEPWFGVAFRSRANPGDSGATVGAVEVIAISPEAVALLGSEPQRLRALASEHAQSEVLPSDLVEDPDVFDTYAEMNVFFARQTKLRALVASGAVNLILADGRSLLLQHRERTLSTLPRTFWFQLACGTLGFLISFWVYTLRPRDRAVWVFSVLGTTIMVFTFAAASYSSRTLAISGTTFRVLSSLNHLGAVSFGAALVVLFLKFPSKIVKMHFALIFVGTLLLWWACDALHLAPNQDVGSRLPIAFSTVVALLFALLQRYRATQAQDRALLRTFGAAVLVGATLFVATTLGPTLRGSTPLIPQAYAFGFFLIMHAGLALSLRRHSIFKLSQASYAVLVWGAFGLLLLVIDAGLVLLLKGLQGVATTMALMLCGLLYLPARTWLWQRATGTKVKGNQAILEAFDIAFKPEEAGKVAWRGLFQRVFDAAEVDLLEHEHAPHPMVLHDAATLDVPSVGPMPPMRVSYLFRGKMLAGEGEAKLAAELCEALRRGLQTRTAFQRGANTERERIAQDLHDDVGARLLTGVYQDAIDDIHATLREALGEVRSIVRELTGKPVQWGEVLNSLQVETTLRCRAADIAIDWEHDPSTESLSEGSARALRSSCRELVSNSIKHSHAKNLHVSARMTEGLLLFEVCDDGKGWEDCSKEQAGYGLINLRKRASTVGGTMNWETGPQGTRALLKIPLSLPTQHVSERELA